MGPRFEAAARPQPVERLNDHDACFPAPSAAHFSRPFAGLQGVVSDAYAFSGNIG